MQLQLKSCNTAFRVKYNIDFVYKQYLRDILEILGAIEVHKCYLQEHFVINNIVLRTESHILDE